MEKVLNILHYSIYLAHYKLHLIANRFNPFRLLHKLPFQKRKYKELGIDIDQEVNSAFRNKDFGLSILVSGSLLIATIFLLIVTTFQGAIKLLDIHLVLNSYIFLIFAGISFIICYLLVFRKNKYQSYFDKFDNWSKSQKRKNIFISIVSTVFVFSLFLILLF